MDIQFDPSAVEALVAAAMALLGAGAGAGVQRRRHAHGEGDGSPLVARLGVLIERQVAMTERMSDGISTLEALVKTDLGRFDAQVEELWGAYNSVLADLDAVSDALDILLTHIGDELPEQARRSVQAKLERRQRFGSRQL